MATETRIPITKPLFGEEELEAIQRPLESGWVVQGPYVEQFEGKFCEFTGAKHSVATSSCTTALHIAVAALGLAPGDEVLVPAFTWVSTANVVEYMGAKPVFVDIDLTTFNVDPELLEAAVTPRTVGIIPVHLFGLAADMDPILELASEHDLWVVEDAACAFGTRYRGAHAGTFGDAGCFSFHPRKSITTGEGGMLTTGSDELAELSRSLRDHGASRSDHARHVSSGSFLLSEYHHLGFNFRMTDMQGALGCVQMDRGQGVLDERTRRARVYDEQLAALGWLQPPAVPAGYEHGYQAYVCLFQPEKASLDNLVSLRTRRNQLMATLEDGGISTRQGTHAAALQGYYRDKYGLAEADFPNASLAEALTITLPLYAQMTDEEQASVVEALRVEGESL
jgi:dTDP-4-amino-4,6-dideoxygalactose transaminase